MFDERLETYHSYLSNTENGSKNNPIENQLNELVGQKKETKLV